MSAPGVDPHAATIVESTLLAARSRRVPPSHRAIVGAQFESADRVSATLTMVDGFEAEVECAQDRRGRWGHRWIRMDGGWLIFQGGRWERMEAA